MDKEPENFSVFMVDQRLDHGDWVYMQEEGKGVCSEIMKSYR
jgi:hypothetical protein